MRQLSLGVLFFAACAQPDIHDAPSTERIGPSWSYLHSVAIPGALSPHLEQSGEIVVVSTASGVWRGSLAGGTLPLAAVSNASTTAVGPDGQLFVARSGPGDLLRIEADGTTTPWVSSFTDGDDDPVGMAFAPEDYTGPVLTPGEGVVVDRGSTGPDGVWRFDPSVANSVPVAFVGDDSDLRDAVDVAVSPEGLFLLDPRENSNGRIYEVLAPDVIANQVLLSAPAEPTGMAWDPTGECLILADATTGGVFAVDPGGFSPSLITVLPSGPYASTTRANIDVSADGTLMVVAADDAIHVYGRCASASPEDDCDNDGVVDACTRITEPGSDCDDDGVLDVCQTPDAADDCDADGIVDVCPLCLDLDVAIVATDSDADAVCDALPNLLTHLSASGIDARIRLYSPTGSTCGAPLLDLPPPTGAPTSLTPLQSCTEPSTAWLQGMAIATEQAFADAPVRRRMVIPLVSSQPSCVSVADAQAARDWVAATVRSYNAAIHPVLPSGLTLASATALADETGGRMHARPPGQKLLGLADAMAARCASADDCDDDDVLDVCEDAGPGRPDCDCDGTYDGCSPLGDPLCVDIDGDGLGLPCDACVDTDGDGVGDPGQARSGCPAGDAVDLCPNTPDPAQDDTDGDGLGDACDPCTDPDGDGVAPDAACPTPGTDNCPLDGNPSQADTDGDGLGDACDPCTDSDGDGAADTPDGGCDSADNCPDLANPDQADTDGDGLGDACDACNDADGDGFGTGTDCPLVGADCDDTRASVNPAATDTPYDGIDQDCSGDDACDLDGDGVLAIVCGGTDCDDSDPTIRPGATEVDGDGIDQDCDPTNELGGCACTTSTSTAPWWLLLLATGWIRTRRATRQES